MGRARSYSDQALHAAVSTSKSWRGVLRALGLAATSASAMRSVRRRADELGLDYGHFTGQRRWSDASLEAAVLGSTSWPEVARRLGLADGASTTTLNGHAMRLGIEVDHLRPHAGASPDNALDMTVRAAHLPRAGSLLAAAWFALCGEDVSWPLEPCRYDLVVTLSGKPARIQVKTTRARAGGSWTVWLSTTRHGRTTYDPDEIDYYFIVDGDLGCYLVPSRVVGGFHAINLAAYSAHRVGSLKEIALADDSGPP